MFDQQKQGLQEASLFTQLVQDVPQMNNKFNEELIENLTKITGDQMKGILEQLENAFKIEDQTNQYEDICSILKINNKNDHLDHKILELFKSVTIKSSQQLVKFLKQYQIQDDEKIDNEKIIEKLVQKQYSNQIGIVVFGKNNVGKKTIIQLLKNSFNLKVEEFDEIFEYTINNSIEIDNINVNGKDFDIFKFDANIEDIQQSLSQQWNYNQFAEKHSNLIYLVVMDGNDESCDTVRNIFDEFAQLFDQEQLKHSHQSFVALIITKCETNYKQKLLRYWKKKYEHSLDREYSYYNELLRSQQSTEFPDVEYEKEGKNLQQLSIDIKNILYNIYQKQSSQKFKLQKVSYMQTSVRKYFENKIKNIVSLFNIFLETLKIEVCEYLLFNHNNLQDCFQILPEFDRINQNYTSNSQQFWKLLEETKFILEKYNRPFLYFKISIFQLKKIEDLLRNFEYFNQNFQLNSFTFNVEFEIFANFHQQLLNQYQEYQNQKSSIKKKMQYSTAIFTLIGGLGMLNFGSTTCALAPIPPIFYYYIRKQWKRAEEQLQNEIQNQFQIL